MNRLTHENILGFVKEMKTAQRNLKLLLAEDKALELQQFLGDLQQMAITLGNTIEASEGEGFVTVSYLEEYCEIIYAVSQGKASDTELDCSLDKVAKSLTEDLKPRREVVFFPYNVNMWDSLESVYLNYKSDPECDVYCVPIPYYELNPNGSVKKMCYDGTRYPDYVEVTDYRKYDFENRHPDEMFIHNPYDEANFVTRVPERFYASNLVKYTEMLVYIPYFILNDITPDNQDAIARIRHFILTPGVIYAHRVVVQSEDMRQIYINVLYDWAVEKGIQGDFADKEALGHKIIAAESPKITKLKRTKKEDLNVPKEWLDFLTESKKTILYNTSLAAFLEDSDTYLDKLEDTLKFFYENRERVTLLWRPHPLLFGTMESMRPQLALRFRTIVSDYVKGGWGIYDDTPDLDRALILSDAYYGDNSSVAKLYKELNKPIMIQNMKLRNME